MADIADKDELELHDLGFVLKQANGKFEIRGAINDRLVATLQRRDGVPRWIANYKMSRDAAGDTDKKLWVNSGYGMGSKAPFVNLTFPGGEVVQMSPDEAREIALNLLQAAQASITDAFIVEWTQQKLNLGLDKAAVLLNDYRTWVKERGSE